MKELLNQWEFYEQAVSEYVEEHRQFTYSDRYLNFRDFMFWVATGRINDTRYH